MLVACCHLGSIHRGRQEQSVFWVLSWRVGFTADMLTCHRSAQYQSRGSGTPKWMIDWMDDFASCFHSCVTYHPNYWMFIEGPDHWLGNSSPRTTTVPSNSAAQEIIPNLTWEQTADKRSSLVWRKRYIFCVKLTRRLTRVKKFNISQRIVLYNVWWPCSDVHRSWKICVNKAVFTRQYNMSYTRISHPIRAVDCGEKPGITAPFPTRHTASRNIFHRGTAQILWLKLPDSFTFIRISRISRREYKVELCCAAPGAERSVSMIYRGSLFCHARGVVFAHRLSTASCHLDCFPLSIYLQCHFQNGRSGAIKWISVAFAVRHRCIAERCPVKIWLIIGCWWAVCTPWGIQRAPAYWWGSGEHVKELLVERKLAGTVMMKMDPNFACKPVLILHIIFLS